MGKCLTGIGMTESEEDLLKSTVSMPYSETAMTARTASDLKGIADKIVGYLCEGWLNYLSRLVG